MKRIATIGTLLLASSAFAFAKKPKAPEINPASGTNVIALLGGSLAVLRARVKNRRL